MIEPIYIAKSRIKGKGVFASRNINIGETICRMRGIKISSKQLYLVSQSGRDIVVDPLQVDNNRYINLDTPYVIINHSCDPNCGIRNGNLIAIRKIRRGQEITYDYSSTWFDGFNCNCGSKICRGHIGDFSSIPKNIREKYFKLGTVPDFIRKNIKS